MPGVGIEEFVQPKLPLIHAAAAQREDAQLAAQRVVDDLKDSGSRDIRPLMDDEDGGCLLSDVADESAQIPLVMWQRLVNQRHPDVAKAERRLFRQQTDYPIRTHDEPLL